MPLYTTYLVLGYWPLGPVFSEVWLPFSVVCRRFDRPLVTDNKPIRETQTWPQVFIASNAPPQRLKYTCCLDTGRLDQ